MNIVVSPSPSFVSNPFFKLYNEELRKRGHQLAGVKLGSVFTCDLLHVNFPEHMVSEYKSVFRALTKAAAMLLFMLIIKFRGKKIIWTVHDVLPLRGNHPRLCSTYMTIVRKMVAGYIFLSPSSLQTFISLYPSEQKKPMLMSFHPMFPVSILDETAKAKYRKHLDLNSDDFIVGFLGDIKAHKNPGLVPLIPETLDNGRKVMLLIAGRAYIGDTTSFEKSLAARKSIHIDKRLEDDELEAFIQIVDVVLLPYSWAWNSGFLLLVLSCHQRTLTSNLPIFIDMQTCFGKKWISLFDLSAADQQKEVTTAINELSAQRTFEADHKQLTHKLEEYSFSRFANQVELFYDRLRADP